ncbi:MAG TPA: PilZ domain-containing protein [Polyangia bacterium]
MSVNGLASTTVPRAKRRHPRAGLPVTASLFANQRALAPALVEDISAGGIRLVTGSPVRRGRMVSVLLDLPGTPVMHLAQVARHVRRAPGQHVIALSFVDLASGEAERIQSFVARFLSELHPCLEFFDTDDGSPRRLVLTDDTPVVG